MTTRRNSRSSSSPPHGHVNNSPTNLDSGYQSEDSSPRKSDRNRRTIVNYRFDPKSLFLSQDEYELNMGVRLNTSPTKIKRPSKSKRGRVIEAQPTIAPFQYTREQLEYYTRIARRTSLTIELTRIDESELKKPEREDARDKSRHLEEREKAVDERERQVKEREIAVDNKEKIVNGRESILNDTRDIGLFPGLPANFLGISDADFQEIMNSLTMDDDMDLDLDIPLIELDMDSENLDVDNIDIRPNGVHTPGLTLD